MEVNEILTAISKIRANKIRKHEVLKRPISPICIPSSISKRPTPIRQRNKSPLSPCVYETSYILPRTSNQLKRFVEAHKYHQFMESKLDAASLFVQFFVKYKKNVFFLLSDKKFYGNFEVSFNEVYNKSKLSYKNKICDSIHKNQSPSFTIRPLSKSVPHLPNWGKLKASISSISKIILLFYYRLFIAALKKLLTTKNLEFPIKLDLEKIKNTRLPHESIDFSSVDDSGFDLGLENSSQFTTRFHQSTERNSKDLNTSSVGSNDDYRSNTDRVMNFTSPRTQNKVLRIKPYSGILDSSFEFKDKGFRARISFPVDKKRADLYGKALNPLFCAVEAFVKTLAIGKIKEFINPAHAKRRGLKACTRMGNLMKSSLGLVFPRLKRANELYKRLQKILANYNLHRFCSVLKAFSAWKIALGAVKLIRPPKINLNTVAGYILYTKKSLRSFSNVLNAKITLTKSRAFKNLKNFSTRLRYKKIGSFFILNAIKRLQKTAKYKSLKYSFTMVYNLTKESRIKTEAATKIIENVSKDVAFRVRACLKHWRSLTKNFKNRFLTSLAFYQSIDELFLSRKRLGFNSLLKRNPPKKLPKVYLILLSNRQSLDLSKSIKTWKNSVKNHPKSALSNEFGIKQIPIKKNL